MIAVIIQKLCFLKIRQSREEFLRNKILKTFIFLENSQGDNSWTELLMLSTVDGKPFKKILDSVKFKTNKLKQNKKSHMQIDKIIGKFQVVYV